MASALTPARCSMGWAALCWSEEESRYQFGLRSGLPSASEFLSVCSMGSESRWSPESGLPSRSGLRSAVLSELKSVPVLLESASGSLSKLVWGLVSH